MPTMSSMARAPCAVAHQQVHAREVESEICTCVSTCVPPKPFAHDTFDALGTSVL